MAGTTETPTTEPSATDPSAATEPVIDSRMPEYPELTPPAGAGPSVAPLSHLLDVSVTVAAEVGRVHMPLGLVLKLASGSLIDLNRAVSDPVDLVVQGVTLARGEIVVVEDRFAIRIKEIVPTNPVETVDQK